MESCNEIPAHRKRKRNEMEAVTNEEEKGEGEKVSAVVTHVHDPFWDRVAAMLEEAESPDELAKSDAVCGVRICTGFQCISKHSSREEAHSIFASRAAHSTCDDVIVAQ
jgi:hypothetical protein